MQNKKSWRTEIQKEKVAIHSAGHNTFIHCHDFVEIVYFKEGIGTHYVDGKKYNVSRGCVCIMEPNVKHYYSANEEYCEKLIVKNLIFYPEFLNLSSKDFLFEFASTKTGMRASQNKAMRFVHVSHDPNMGIERLLDLIENELYMKKDNYYFIVGCLIEAILLFLISDRDKWIAGKKHNKNYSIIETSISYLNENIQNTPTIREMAKKVGFSQEYYSKLFRDFTGKSYVQFVHEMKCNEACRLLEETAFTNETIAQLVGYSSQKQFYQQFKKILNITPSEYKKYILN